MYRSDRHDVPADVPADAPLDDQLDFCQNNRIRLHNRNRIVSLRPAPGAPTHFGELFAAWLDAPWRRKVRTATLWPLFAAYRLFAWRWAGRWFNGYEPLHHGAPGDFTLLARDAWFRLRGHPELEMYSLNLDTLFLHAAHHAGYREEVLADPMRVYHVEHGLGWVPELEAQLDARLAAAGIERLSRNQLQEWIRTMQRERRPLCFSGEDWGLARESLPETVITPGSPDHRGVTNPAPVQETTCVQ
jgi:hypothetical protein